ncbi:MAG: hypothetical protein KUG77_13490 [Nannocystaceae bacterium]|nr:hypothetical protein [Nannocystaceae bacterium]
MPDKSRQERRFDLEAEKRSRRNFVLMIVGFALLAMVGGVALALWVLSPPDEDTVPPITKVAARVEDPTGFEPFEDDEREPEVRKVRAGVRRKLEKGDVDRGLGKIRAALNQCSAKHGAIDKTLVTVDFSVASNGRVTEAYSRSPHSKTPLGLCVAKVIRQKATFRKTKEGLGDIRRTLTLRRTSL